MDLVVVESPTKAKSIAKYLGPGYQVTASFGHVRDLLAEEDAVRPEEDFAMSFAINDDKEKRVKEIGRGIKGKQHLYLATDPDREGEAISWHLLTVLKEGGLLNGVDVKRVVFHEVTKNAVLDAMRHPRDLDQNLIDAYLARRALDHLVGFRLSPILWRKLPGARSAGRVQSVALRLICERENAIEAFRPREYWTVEALLKTDKEGRFKARLSRLGGQEARQSSTSPPRRMRRPPSRRSTPLSCASPTSRRSRWPATRPRRSQPRPCSRRPRASWGSPPTGR